jgi:hypothetical protein
MLMVLLLGVGACVSLFLLYKNKQKITFELLKYYTYIDEYLSKLDRNTSKDTHFLYPQNGTLLETSNLKTALINIKGSQLPYLITKDFLVMEIEENQKHSKTFYKIYKINETTDEIKEETRDIMGEINPIDVGIGFQKYEEELNELIFSTQMTLLQNIKWSPEIIAASITIEDKENIYKFIEYDITDFFIALFKEDGLLTLTNEKEAKILWLYIFNYIFKNKHVVIPIENNTLDNITISWNIVLSDCSIIEGKNITLDLKQH